MVESAHAPRLKEVYASVKKFKTGKMVWHLVGVGSQLVLESLQGCLSRQSEGVGSTVQWSSGSVLFEVRIVS